MRRRLDSSPVAKADPDSAQFEAFQNFAHGGIGATGAGSKPLLSSAPPFVPQVLPPAAPPGMPAHSPWMAVSKVNAQARTFLEALGAAEAIRSFKPYWQREFWAMVTRAGQQEPLEADVRLALSRAGYVGDATITSVPASLRAEILRDTRTPAHGAGGGAFAQPSCFSTSTKPEDNPLLHGRLAHGLALVSVAAPEIYTACIAERARSIRDWNEIHLSCSKGTDA